MSNSKEVTITNDVLLIDALLTVRALQNLLIKKELISFFDLEKELKLVSKTLLKSILEKANVPGDLDELIETLQTLNK